MWQFTGILLLPALAILAGLLAERLLRALRVRWMSSAVIALLLMAVAVRWSVQGYPGGWESLSFDGLKFLLPAGLALLMLICPRWVARMIGDGLPREVIMPQVAEFYRGFYSSLLLLVLSAQTPFLPEVLDLTPPVMWFAGLAYWLAAVAIQLLALNRMREISLLCQRMIQALGSARSLHTANWLGWLHEEFSLPLSFIEQVFSHFTARMQARGEVVTMELDNARWVFSSAWYAERMAHFESLTAQRLYHSEEELQLAFRTCFSLPETARDLSLDRYCELVRRVMQQESAPSASQAA